LAVHGFSVLDLDQKRLDLDKTLEREYDEAVRFAMSEELTGRHNEISGAELAHILTTHPIDIPKDPMEADYMRANAIATNNQRALEKAAASNGLTVEEYMAKNNLLTDTHLAPWARS
jgi:hypothetical protein